MKKLYTIIALAILILIVVAIFISRDLFFQTKVRLTEAENYWLEEKDIRVGVIGKHNHYDYKNGYNGIIADHIKLIQKKLNKRFILVEMSDEEEALRLLENGEIDVTASIYIPPEQRKNYINSFPVFNTFIFVASTDKDTEAFNSGDLSNSNVGVIEGSISEKVLRGQISPDMSYRTFVNPEAGFEWVSRNEKSYLLVDDFSYMGLTSVPDFVNLAVLNVRYSITLATVKHKPLLNSILNKGFGMISKEEYREIVHRWTGFLKRNFWQTKDFGYLIITLLGAAALVFLMILIWNFSLKKRVTLQTSVLRKEYEARIAAQHESQEKEKQLLHADRMVSLGTLVSGVAHEINNPNNYIRINARLVKDIFRETMPVLDSYAEENPGYSIINIPYEDMKQEIANITAGLTEGSSKIEDIVKSLKEFARPDSHDWNMEVDIKKAVESAVKITANTIKNRNIELSVELADSITPVCGNSGRLEQVIINLLTNASEAIVSSNGKIELKAYMSEEDVVVMVKDNGKGIRKEDLPRVADPFFTTRSDDGGVGLGLSISMSIIRRFRGRMEYKSAVGAGTEVRIVIPVDLPEPEVEHEQG